MKISALTRSAAIAILLAALAASCASQPLGRNPAVPLGQPAEIDVMRYLGKWHEIARFPNGFQRGCVASTAEYGLTSTPYLSVVNRCRLEGQSTFSRTATGRIRKTDGGTGQLEVSFFGPFFADYWVLDRAEDYSWSLVGEPTGRYLWILARTPTISEALKADLLGRLRARGYDTDKLIWGEPG
jgi:apolipoprotein D and lipocalin family protein